MRRFSGDKPEKKNFKGKSTVGKTGRPSSDKPWTKTGDNSDKPWKRSNEGTEKSWVRKDRSFDKNASDSKGISDRPWKKSENSTDKPYKKRENTSDRPNSDRPWKKDERTSSDRPWKKDERTSSDRPWKKDERTSSDRPFKKEERTSSERPWKKDEGSGSDRPFKREDRSSSDRPWKKDEGTSSEGPYKREDRPSTDRPYKREERPSSDRPYKREDRPSTDRPYKREDRASSDRPYKRDDRPSSERPYKREERTSSDRPYKREDRPSSDRPYKRDDRPSSDRPYKREERTSSDRPYKRDDRPSSDRPYKRDDRPSADRPYKKRDDNRESTDRSRTYSDKPREKKASKSGFLTDEPIRLNKYIANAGVCSRREADTMIEAGAVTVNGIVVTELGTKVNPGDKVQIGNDTLNPQKKVYLLLNKPKGYITTVDDPQERNTVMMLVKDACRERIYPVGRLDRNTSGLLLMTNDGEIAKKLTHPSHRVRKIYQVELDKALTKADMIKMTEGIELEDGVMAIDEIAYTGAGDDKKSLGVVIHSGKNRIVRRMFEALEYEVVKLDRVAFANLTKKDLPRGRWRFLEESEINMLKMI